MNKVAISTNQQAIQRNLTRDTIGTKRCINCSELQLATIIKKQQKPQ